MRLLLDTHILIWCLQDNPRLAEATRARILTQPTVYVSSASIWEIALKVSAGKFQLDMDELLAQITQIDLTPLPISHEHAAMVRLLPYIHRDPFDRMLVAQAMCESVTLLTADRLLADYSDLVELV
jgi:PIN domain nuclease of toxin-antitoxin system